MKNERGFTLIELLVAIAIVAILASILVPQYAAYKKQAVAATFAAAIASCGSELAAANAVDNTVTNRSCQIPGGGTCSLLIDNFGLLNGCLNANISGVDVICNWNNNQIICNPS